MRKIYLHIGTHKTGTSSIQKFMSDNYSNLIKYGFLYPKVARVSHGSHHNLQFQITNDPRYKTKLGGWVELLKEINESNCENVVLSCEAFSTLQGGDLMPHYIYSFAQKFRFDVEVICYLRPQYELIESLWLQETKSGQNILSFDDYVIKQMLKPRFNYLKLFQAWSNYFKTSFYMFDENVKDKGIIPCFISAIGASLIPSYEEELNVNNRVSYELTEIIRGLTARLWKKGFTKAQTERWAHKFRFKHSDYGSRYGVLTNRNAIKIFDYFEKSNKELSYQYPELQKLSRPPVEKLKIQKLDNLILSERECFFMDIISDLSSPDLKAK
ncbi:hypothetical protein ACJJH9_03220 [Microbulbifer sp. DLAB2-AF]|uniref:hypothetical protein n=1 Tax=Microbulbifer sp. DLAB2-AF TaxID=3243395 RepID=UPI0040397AE5